MILDKSTFVDKAKEVMEKHLSSKNKVTTSQIRNLLALTADIYNDVIISKDEKLNEDVKSRLNYLKVRFVYEAGRKPEVRDFVEKAEILECLDEIRGLKANYLCFSRYMEALVAYHKWYGGRD